MQYFGHYNRSFLAEHPVAWLPTVICPFHSVNLSTSQLCIVWTVQLKLSFLRRSSRWSWSTHVWRLSTSLFTASHCLARDISVPLSEIYSTYHVTDSARMATPKWPTHSLNHSPGFCHCWSVRLEQSSWTLSATRMPPKSLSGACWKHFTLYQRTERIEGALMLRHTNLCNEVDRDIPKR